MHVGEKGDEMKNGIPAERALSFPANFCSWCWVRCCAIYHSWRVSPDREVFLWRPVHTKHWIRERNWVIHVYDSMLLVRFVRISIVIYGIRAHNFAFKLFQLAIIASAEFGEKFFLQWIINWVKKTIFSKTPNTWAKLFLIGNAELIDWSNRLFRTLIFWRHSRTDWGDEIVHDLWIVETTWDEVSISSKSTSGCSLHGHRFDLIYESSDFITDARLLHFNWFNVRFQAFIPLLYFSKLHFCCCCKRSICFRCSTTVPLASFSDNVKAVVTHFSCSIS